MDTFRAYRIDDQDGRIVAGFKELDVDDLSDGNVLVKVSHSTINYKDALAATGTARILRRYPLNGGIDLAGTVVTSDDAAFQPGAPVLVNGCGLSETVDGGYSEYARIDSASLVPIPDNISPAEARRPERASSPARAWKQPPKPARPKPAPAGQVNRAMGEARLR